MSENPFISPLVLKIKTSAQKKILIIAPHLCLLILVLWMDIFTPSLKLLLIFLIIVSVNYYLRIVNNTVTELRQDSKNNWKISSSEKHKNGGLFSVDLHPSSFVSTWIIILNFIDNNHSNHRIIITPDSISINDFRHLTTRLKITNIKKS